MDASRHPVAQPQTGARWSAAMADPVDGVRRAFDALRRHWLLALAAFIAVLSVVLSYGLTRTKLYTATANMVVNTRELNIAEKDKEVLPVLPNTDTAVATEVEIMRSAAVARGTVEALALTRNPRFAGALEGVPPADRDAAAAAMLSAGLKIDRPGTSNVVTIAYTSPDPMLAKAVADQVAQQYLKVKQQSRRAAVEQVDRGLGDQLERLRVQLEDADAAVAAYRAQHQLFDTENATFTEQELSTYKQQQATAQAALADAEAKLRIAHAQTRGGGSGGVAAVLQSPVVQQLREQRAQVAATYADLATRYKPEHPDLIRAREQLDALDRAISAETAREVASLGANVRIARQQLATADATVARTTGALAADNNASVALAQLQRKADGLRDTYQALLTRRNSISSQALVADEDARVLSLAALPLHPSGPNKALILLAGIGLALIGACGAVWLVEAFDRKLVSSADIEQKLGVPHVANVPAVASVARREDRTISPIDFAWQRPHSIYAESLRAVRLALVRESGEGGATVGITSARPREGKTSLSIALARTSALAGSRTLLVDADLRRPSVAAMLGLPAGPGLVEVLRGTATLDQAIVRDGHSGMMVLRAGDTAADHFDLFDPARVRRLIGELGQRFDLSIFDTAPANAVTDARLLLRQMDAVLMALRWNHTPRQAAATAIRRLRALDIEPLGLVATMVDMRALAAFGHGDVDREHADYGAYYDR